MANGCVYTHDGLHFLIKSDPRLRARSVETHILPIKTEEEKKQGTLAIMEIYAEAVGCKQVASAREFVERIFSSDFREPLDDLHQEFGERAKCHTILGDDYFCYCDEGELLAEYVITVYGVRKDGSPDGPEEVRNHSVSVRSDAMAFYAARELLLSRYQDLGIDRWTRISRITVSKVLGEVSQNM